MVVATNILKITPLGTPKTAYNTQTNYKKQKMAHFPSTKGHFFWPFFWHLLGNFCFLHMVYFFGPLIDPFFTFSDISIFALTPPNDLETFLTSIISSISGFLFLFILRRRSVNYDTKHLRISGLQPSHYSLLEVDDINN